MLTEFSVPHMVIPGVTEFARGGLPDPPSTDDGNCRVGEDALGVVGDG
ncbi:hypothetical protein ACIQ9P_11880 [Kitasatospora sp. NPDC094019]